MGKRWNWSKVPPQLLSRQTLIVHIKHPAASHSLQFFTPTSIITELRSKFIFDVFCLLPLSRNVVNLRILIVILVCHNKRTAHFPKQSALSQCNAGSCKIKHPLQQMPSAPYIKQQKENKEDNEELSTYQSQQQPSNRESPPLDIMFPAWKEGLCTNYLSNNARFR